MKAFVALVSVSALFCTLSSAAEAMNTNQERVQVQNEIQNRFKNMSTDELLNKRGTMTTQQEREQLHNELMNRQQTMTKEQKEKFNNRPENRTPKMKNQGQGQGMMQGQRKGMGGGMGGGGGGR